MTDLTERLYGLEAVAQMFRESESENRAAFLPYFPIGYPDYETSLDIITAMSQAGVDGFEIGIPFSDPLADGPVIQEASQIALENGTTPTQALLAVKTLRERGVTQPMMMMGYLNPILAYGPERFVKDAKAAGADGFIIPDLPAEEAGIIAPYCEAEGMAMVFFLAPTSNEKRVEVAAAAARGFIYVVSVTGITGERRELPPDLQAFISRLRKTTNVPLVMGFGISTPEQARAMNDLVNGFIVGSALVRAGKDGVAPVRELTEALRNALN